MLRRAKHSNIEVVVPEEDITVFIALDCNPQDK
jgi:hypothetical protein